MFKLIELFGFIVFWFILIRVILIWLLIPLIRYAWIYWRPWNLSNSINNDVFRPSPNNWAIVTGGTDGIGLAYCRCLAKLGYPLLIISRNEQKLLDVRNQLLKECPQTPEIRLFQFDFSENFESKNYENLNATINQLPNIDVLVNNVGISFKIPEFFNQIKQQDPDFFRRIVNVNIVSMFRMIMFCLESMVPQKRGIIINISSVTGVAPFPLLSAYSSTKAAVDHFTRCLSLELKQQHPNSEIIVQSLMPGFVSTKMSKMPPSRWVPSADDYVEKACLSVGHTDRSAVHWFHCLQLKFNQLVIYCFGDYLFAKLAFNHLYHLQQKYHRARKDLLASKQNS